MTGDDQRIVVTGVGLWTPFAPRSEESWSALVNGRRGVRWLTAAEGIPLSVSAAEPPRRWAGAPAAERPAAQVAATLAVSVVQEALAAAQLDPLASEPGRFGCVFGTSKGTFESLAGHASTPAAQPSSPSWQPCAPSGPLEAILANVGGIGPATCPVAACATGAMAILQGARWIEQGRCDTVIAGSADAALQPALLASYRRLGVLARIDDAPETAARPFDRRRSGFAVGEGAAAVVLERLSEAKRRGRTPLAEWRGGIHLSDPSSLLRGDRTGETIAETIRRLLRQTGTPADEIDGVSLHGTGTLENDLAESRGVRAALNPRQLAAFSLKGAIGHLLGGAGSVETVAGILALRDQIIPPTVNLVEPDPDCLPEAVQSLPQRRLLRNLLKLSLGFGGHVAALQFQRWQG